MDESKVEAAKPVQTSLVAPSQEVKPETPDPLSPQSALAALQSDVQPVGHDYVEEVQLRSFLSVFWKYFNNAQFVLNA